jgi:hypothetical protein
MSYYEKTLTQQHFEGQPAFYIRPPLTEPEITGLGRVLLEASADHNAVPHIHDTSDATVVQLPDGAHSQERNFYDEILMHLLMRGGKVTTKDERPIKPYGF